MDAAPLTAEEEALREDLAEVRLDRDAVQALHSDALELLAATRAELDSAWQATGVASTVRGLTTLADVVTTLRESAAELRRERDAAVEALAKLRADAGAVVSDLHRANQLGREVRQAAIERVIAARLERDEARRWASMYARSFGRLQSALRLSSEVPLEESVSRILALVGAEKMEPAQPSTPCAECALRDINGECSAQCVAASAARGER